MHLHVPVVYIYAPDLNTCSQIIVLFILKPFISSATLGLISYLTHSSKVNYI